MKRDDCPLLSLVGGMMVSLALLARDVGATAVFDRRLDPQVLTFEPAGDGRFRDRETGSSWLLSGRAAEAPLAGRRLAPVPHGNHFWFAWAAFRPGARLVK